MKEHIDPMEIFRKTGMVATFGSGGEFSKSFVKKLAKIGITPEQILNNHAFEQVREIGEKQQKGRIIVEAAHIYTDNDISRQHEVGCTVGRLTHDLFSEIGYDVENWLFIDDIQTPDHNPIGRTFDYNAYHAFLEKNGFCPDVVTWESKLTGEAEELISRLRKGGKVMRRHGKYYLRGDVHGSVILADENGPKCSVLDAAYHIKKLRSAGYAVTVLPIFTKSPVSHAPVSFKAEQSNMKKVMKEAGEDPKRVLNIFFDTDILDSVPETFSDESIIYLKTIPVALINYFDGDVNQASLNSFIQHCRTSVLPHVQRGNKHYKLPFDIGAMTYVC